MANLFNFADSKKNEFFKFRASLDKRLKSACLYPLKECQSETIRSHSTPESVLRLLESEGHVLVPQMSIDSRPDLLDFSLGLLKKEGVGKAGTFHGFCAAHDNSFFEEVDVSEFELSESNLRLVFFRSLSRALYENRNSFSRSYRSIQETTPGSKEGALKAMLALRQMTAVLEQLENGYERLKRSFRKQDATGSCSHLVLHVKGYVPFAASFTFFPTYSIDGEQFSEELGTPVIGICSLIGVNVVPSRNGGMVVLSWLDEAPNVEKFLMLLDNHLVSDILSMESLFALSLFEAIPCIAPSWHSNLRIDEKKWIESCGSEIPHTRIEKRQLEAPRKIISADIEDAELLGDLSKWQFFKD